ncbi:MAG: hypothetical protein RLZZ417_1626 [Bacteroidota bacterium]|jgi:hypothetical protein
MISFSIAQFQNFYKEEIIPVLSEFNRRRIKLLCFSCFLGGGFFLGVFVNWLFNLFVLTILIFGVSIYGLFHVSYIGLNFKIAYKTSLTSFMMKYFMQAPEIIDLSYKVHQWVDKKVYLESGFFPENLASFKGYGQMEGKVGEVSFTLSELQVMKTSKMDNKIVPQFEGFFLHGKLPFKTTGAAIIWSRKEKQAVHSAIRKFTWLGAENKDAEQHNYLFKSLFATYASPETLTGHILSEAVQEMMIRFYQKTGRALYFSYVERDIYVAVSAPVNLLTIPLFKKFRPDTSILTFLEIHLILFSILQEFDFHH